MRISPPGLTGNDQVGFESQATSFVEGLLDEEGIRSSGPGLSAGRIRQIHSLAEEQDPQIFFNELLKLGRDFEKDHRDDLAGFIYQHLSKLNRFTQLKARAKKQWDALQGLGPLSSRLERGTQSLLNETFSIPTVLGMTVGGLAFRAARLGLLSRLLPQAQTLGRMGVIGARGFSSTAALLPEAFAFTGTIKLSQSLTGNKVNWDPNLWTQEMIGTALMLGPLRFFGHQAKVLGKALGQIPMQGPASQLLLGQFGMYTGILAGHHVQGWAGFRQPGLGSEGWLGALGTLIQFNLAGAFAHRLLGRHFQSLEKNLDAKVDFYLKYYTKQTNLSPSQRPILTLHPNRAPLGPPLPEANFPHLIRSERFRDWYETVLQVIESSIPGKSSQHKTIDEVETLVQAQEYAKKINQLFSKPIPALAVLPHNPIQNLAPVARALPRLYHILKHTHYTSHRGSYADRLSNLAVQKMLKTPQGSMRLRRILQFLHEGGSLKDYEKLLANWTMEYSLVRPPKSLEALSQIRDLELRINRLPLSPKARETLKTYFIKNIRRYQKNPEQLQDKIRFLPTLEGVLIQSQHRPLIENALIQAADSPFGAFRLHHLWDVISYESHAALRAKLRELGDPNLRLSGETAQPNLLATLKNFSGTQWSAYLEDPIMAKRFRMIYLRLPSLLDPAKATTRWTFREKALDRFWMERSRRGALTPMDLVHAFRLLGDPISRRVARHIEKRNYDMDILPEELFQARLRKSLSKHPRELEILANWKASYRHPTKSGEKGLVLLKQFSPEKLSRPQSNEALFELLSSAVQEDAHYLDIRPGTELTRGVTLRVETLGNAEQFYWEALHGKNEFLTQAAREGSQGIAMFLRDKVEEWYYPQFPSFDQF